MLFIVLADPKLQVHLLAFINPLAEHKYNASSHSNILIFGPGRRVKLSGPIEYVWSHGQKYKVVGFSCGYCGKNNSGGGATRFREHLAGISGSVVACEKVPLVVRNLMLDQGTKLKIRSKKIQSFVYLLKKRLCKQIEVL